MGDCKTLGNSDKLDDKHFETVLDVNWIGRQKHFVIVLDINEEEITDED